MGRLFDEEELGKYIMHDGCEKGCGYIDERDLKYIQPTEAIPKDQYEARLTELRSMALRVKHNTGSINTLIDKLDDLLSEVKE